MNTLEKVRTKYLFEPVRNIPYRKIPIKLRDNRAEYMQKHNLRNPTININSMIEVEISECLRF